MYYLIACICCFYIIWKLCSRNKTNDEPPVLPRSLPLVGHGLLFVGDSIKSYNNITWIAEECLMKGGVLSGSFGFRKAYCVTDSEAIVTISNSCLEKEYMYSFAKAFVGEGLITGSGPLWKKHRKLLNPAFSQQVLNSFMQCFNHQARSLVDQLASQVEKPFDHEKILKRNHLESICLTATGIGSDEYSSLQEKYLLLIPKLATILYERFKQLWYHSNFIYSLSNLKRAEDEVLRTCADLSKQMIHRKREDMQTARASCTLKNQDTVKPFLELILDISNEQKCFTDEQIRHETDTIIAAAHETSATILNLALILLGSHPEIQKQVYNEVLLVLGNPDGDLNKDDLTKLVYTEAVLKETLRLYPAVPVVARHIHRDIKLKNYTLKANSACFLFLYGLNRHPVWGPDADQFRPERWFDIATLPGKDYFGSFSLGKRNCIGKAYAMMSMKTTLAHVIRRYDIKADISKVVFKWHMVTYPASGHHYTLRQR